MNYLLDTHAFLWAYAQSKRLPTKVRTVIEDSSSNVFVSAVSFWEISIKMKAGRLDVSGLSATDLLKEARRMDFSIIPIEADEAASQHTMLENTHFDPFDRLLIWQAISRKLVLVSNDAAFNLFAPDGLELLW